MRPTNEQHQIMPFKYQYTAIRICIFCIIFCCYLIQQWKFTVKKGKETPLWNKYYYVLLSFYAQSLQFL